MHAGAKVNFSNVHKKLLPACGLNCGHNQATIQSASCQFIGLYCLAHLGSQTVGLAELQVFDDLPCSKWLAMDSARLRPSHCCQSIGVSRL